MKKIINAFIILLIAFLGYKVFAFFSAPDYELDFGSSPKNIVLNDNGFFYDTETSAATVESFLQEKSISLDEHDRISPEPSSALLPGANISIKRALKIKVLADGKTSELYTLENSVAGAIWENNIYLGEDDFTKPVLNSILQNNITIEVIRVDIKKEVVKKDIPFKTTANEDDKLSWRTKKVTQRGEKGIKEVTYKVVSHNGKEISRKALAEKIVEEPTLEIVVQGTYMKLGKATRGDASYYASGWGELNASRTIPRGGFAKVTNLDNGKSVVVKINDYGPQSPRRVTDLSYVSFSKIGDLEQGILHNVKVEQILN